MIELDLNEATLYTDSVINELQYSCLVYNVEECGMQWHELETLFGDNAIIAEARYEAENRAAQDG